MRLQLLYLFHLGGQRPEQLDKDETQRVDVNLVIVRFALDLFGTHVHLRADLVGVQPLERRESHAAAVAVRQHGRVIERLLGHGSDQPEIAYLDRPVGSEKDV